MSKPAASLLKRIERHCRAAAIAETTFGRHVVNDGKLVGRLRSGRSITLATLRRIEAAIRRDSPDGGAATASAAGKGRAAP
jgi:hypothetical protein